MVEREELLVSNPFRHLKAPKPDHKMVQALTPNEIDRLFKACADKSFIGVRGRAVLSVFLDTGLRLSELINLTMDDLNLETGSIMVRCGKGGKQRDAELVQTSHIKAVCPRLFFVRGILLVVVPCKEEG